MRIFHSDHYFADVGAHVMPMRKFGLVRDAIAALDPDARLLAPEPIDDAALARVHTREYIDAVASGEPRALAESQKFPWSAALANAVRHTNGGCVAALAAALEDGVAGNLASGFHHAHADHGEGFCTFNGLVVAIDQLRASARLERALVVDLDLHYGNGTASLLADRPYAFNLSIYGNWYAGNTAYRDVDEGGTPDTDNCFSVPVPAGTGGARYLELVSEHLDRALAAAKPDAILYQAGADPLRDDPYSPLDLGHADLRERDRLVFARAKELGIPVAWVLAGGYTKDVSQVVEVHVNTWRAATAVFTA